MCSYRTAVAAQALVLALAYVTACETSSRRTVMASNGEWSVTAIGPLGKADHEITFDVHRRGHLYASGYLHFDSDSFNLEFPNRTWVAPNVLHLSSGYGGAQYELVLRNGASSAIKWIRIGSQDVFLAFDVPPGAAIRLASVWYTYGFHIRGEFADGRPLPDARAFQEPAVHIVDIVVGDANASIHFVK